MLARECGYEKDRIISIEGGARGSDYFIDELKQLPVVESAGWVQYSPVYNSRVGMSLDHNGESVHLELAYGDSTAFRILGFNILKFNPSNSKMKMQGNKILMEFELNGLEYEATMKVNYCPQCGRELTEDK